MSASELLKLSISELSVQIKARKVSPVELTEAALTQADRLQPILCSFITILHDQAMRQAKEQVVPISRRKIFEKWAECSTSRPIPPRTR